VPRHVIAYYNGLFGSVQVRQDWQVITRA